MKKLSRILAMGLFSSCLYCLIEILFRGFSHWTMFLLAFIVGLILTWLNDTWIEYETPYEIQVFIGTSVCVLFEFIFGMIFNRNFEIWDYRLIPFGTFAFGQLNIVFCGAWMLICAFGLPLLDWLQYRLGLGPRPYYYTLTGKKIIL